MPVSGNSFAGKSYMSFTVSEELLAKVVEAVQAGEKQARTSGSVQSFEVFSKGFRANIALGRIYIVPAKVCNSREDFPTALLYGCLVKTFGTGGEELGDFIDKKIGESEFDEYSQADFDSIREKLFPDGKSLILYAPMWWNKREYVAFSFTEDGAQLRNNIRHMVFAAYYDPRFSSAFDACVTNVDTTKVDVTDITPKLNFPFLAENLLREYPDLVKQAGRKKEKVLLNRKTADAITKQQFDPQEIDVFDSLNQALTEALVPSVDDAEEAGEERHTEESEFEVPRAASKAAHKGEDGKCRGCGHADCTCKDCECKKASVLKVAYVSHCPGHRNSKGELAEWCIKDHKDDHIINSFKSEDAARKGLQNMHAHSGSAKKADAVEANPPASHESPFINVGPGTEAAEKQEPTVKGMKETVEKVDGAPPIGIAIDETGVPRRDDEKPHVAKAEKKAAPADNPPSSVQDPKHPETLRVGTERLSSAYSAAYNGGFVDRHAMPPATVRAYLNERMGSNDEYAPHAAADHAKEIAAGKYGETPLTRRSNEKWGSVTAAQIKADFVADHIAADFDLGYEVASEKTKKANAAREERLSKLRPKQAVALDIDTIWDEITEDMGPAPVVDVEVPAGDESSEGNVENEPHPGRPNKKDIGALPEALTSDEPEDDKAMSDSEAKSQEDSMPEPEHREEPESESDEKPWSVSSSMEDFVKEAFDELEDIGLSENAMAAAREAIERGDDIIYDVAANAGQIVDNVKHMTWFQEEVARAILEQEEAEEEFHRGVEAAKDDECDECKKTLKKVKDTVKKADTADNGYDIDSAADPTSDEVGPSDTVECHQDHNTETSEGTDRPTPGQGADIKTADTADNPYAWDDGKGAPEDKKNVEKADTSGPDAPCPGMKSADEHAPTKVRQDKPIGPGLGIEEAEYETTARPIPLEDRLRMQREREIEMSASAKPKKADGIEKQIEEARSEAKSPYSTNSNTKPEVTPSSEMKSKTAEVHGMEQADLIDAINLSDGDGLIVTDWDEIAADIEGSVYQIGNAQDLGDVITALAGAGLVVEDEAAVRRNAELYWQNYQQRGKTADGIEGDAAEAKAETVSPDTVDKDIKQPTESAEEAAKVADDLSADAAEAKAETESPDTVDPNIKQETVGVEEASKQAADTFQRKDDVPAVGDHGDGGALPSVEAKQPTSDLSGAQPEAHDVPPQVDSKVSALTDAEKDEDAMNGICPLCGKDDTETIEAEDGKVLYCHGCERETWKFRHGRVAAAGDELPEEIEIDLGAGDLANIVMAEDEDGEK